MSASNLLPLAVWASGTNQNSLPANDNALRVEVLAGPIVSIASAQPASPAERDQYILGPAPSGAQWSLLSEGDAVIFVGGSWYGFSPFDGWLKFNQDDGDVYQYTIAGGWDVFAAGGGGGGGAWGSITGTLSDQTDLQSALNAKASTTYVDGLVLGLSWKKSVRAATTTAGTLATSFENGDTIDGVTLATGDRILIKSQSTASENGIYTVNASGAPTRATDADTGSELVNATVMVQEGTTLADTQWTCSTNAPITIGSTSISFAQLSAGGGGGLTNWTEAAASAAPNNVVPVVSFTATNAASNVDAALVPKGTGSILANVPDSTATGGSKRGARAVDLQLERSAAAQVASGTNAVIGGGRNNTSLQSYGTVAGGDGNAVNGAGSRSAIGGGGGNTASGSYAIIPGGLNCTASANYAHASGSTCAASADYAQAGGFTSTADGVGSRAFGQFAAVRGVRGADAFAAGRRTANGDAQRRSLVLFRTTGDGTSTALTADGTTPSTANQLNLPSALAFKVRGQVIAMRSNGDVSAWDVSFIAKRVGTTTSIVGSPTITNVGNDGTATGYALAIAADDTNDVVQINVTGTAGHTVYWSAELTSVEVG